MKIAKLDITNQAHIGFFTRIADLENELSNGRIKLA